jgi:hypothetical protein
MRIRITTRGPRQRDKTGNAATRTLLPGHITLREVLRGRPFRLLATLLEKPTEQPGPRQRGDQSTATTFGMSRADLSNARLARPRKTQQRATDNEQDTSEQSSARQGRNKLPPCPNRSATSPDAPTQPQPQAWRTRWRASTTSPGVGRDAAGPLHGQQQ